VTEADPPSPVRLLSRRRKSPAPSEPAPDAALCAIRALPGKEFGRLPIIALTASTRLGNADAITTAGFTDYIAKPFKPDHLFSKLALYGARPQATLEQGAESPPEASPSALGPTAPRPHFNLDNFRNMAEGDLHALREFNAIVVHSAEQAKKDFQQALSTGDLEAFDLELDAIILALKDEA